MPARKTKGVLIQGLAIELVAAARNVVIWNTRHIAPEEGVYKTVPLHIRHVESDSS